MLVWSRSGRVLERDQRKVVNDNDNDNDNDNATWPGQAPAGSRHQRQLDQLDQLQDQLQDQLREHVSARCALVALVELERWRVASF